MKTSRFSLAVLVLTIVSGSLFVPVYGMEREAIDAIVLDVPQLELERSREKKGFFRWWKDYMDSELAKVSEMDLFGVTGQLPRGYFSMKWDWTTIRASQRYNDQRKLGPVMEPIRFKNNQGEDLIAIDMGLEGHGGGHTFQWSYGINDELDWYFELPFTYMNVSFYPTPLPVGTNRAGETIYIDEGLARQFGIRDPAKFSGCDMNYYVLPMLNRPPVAVNTQARWLLGDINTGFSWNIYRDSRFSVALTPRVFLPTGHTPHPDNNLTYGTGSEIETGIGGWAAGFTQGYDVRLFKYSYWVDIVFSSEFTAAYAFTQKRPYPTNFPDMRNAENPNAPTPGELLDPMMFPQLHHLSGTFEYTPGWSVGWNFQLGVQLAMLGLSAGWGFSHTQEPELRGDRSFINMAKGLELLGAQSIEALQLGASLSLFPIYIPVDIGFSWTKVLDGYNAIVFDDYYSLVVKAYIPLFR